MTGSLERLFRPRSVALIGASTDPKKIGGRPLHFLRKHGFEGEIWPVNPHAVEIEGYRSYPDVDSLPGVPDIAVVLVGHSGVATASLARKVQCRDRSGRRFSRPTKQAGTASGNW